MHRKQLQNWCSLILFFLLCAAVIWFLHLFSVDNGKILHIDWTSAVQVHADGTETPIDTDTLTNAPDFTGTYLFSGKLPDDLPDGTLVFETSNAELTLWLNGLEIYHSNASAAENSPGMAQASIPLPAGTSGTLAMQYEILDETNVMFPPYLRFLSDLYTEIQSAAATNYAALPAGACALAFLLIAGVFLLGLSFGQVNFSLLPLALSALGLTVYNMVIPMGYYFLPASVTEVLGNRMVGVVILLSFLVYLIMNRRRDFLKRFAVIAACSFTTLLVFCLLSFLQEGKLIAYVKEAVMGALFNDFYDPLIYWLSYWLTLVCAALSAYELSLSFVRQRTETQAAAIRNQLLMNNYRTLQEKTREQSAMRHEIRHHLTALESLCKSKDYEQMTELLERLKGENEKSSHHTFTENETLNIILQDIAQRAEKEQTSFTPRIQVPAKLNIPTDDLCSFVMNMLENALEGCLSVQDPKDRFIRFQIKMVHGFLAIRCENSYGNDLIENEQGELQTTKKDADLHGFGLHQMSRIAEKYHSVLSISHTEDSVFLIQTALKIPE